MVLGVTLRKSDAIGSSVNNNMFHYSSINLVDGLTLTASYVPTMVLVLMLLDFAVDYTGVEGLTLVTQQLVKMKQTAGSDKDDCT